MSAWPSISCSERRSQPPASRCVAKVWRSVCGLIFAARPGAARVALDDLVEPLAGEAAAAVVDEQRRLPAVADEPRAAALQVGGRARATASLPIGTRRSLEPLPRARRTPASRSMSPTSSSIASRRAARRRTSAPAARGRAAPPARCPRGWREQLGDLVARSTCGSLRLCLRRAQVRRSGRARAAPRGAGGGRRSAGRRPCAAASRARRAGGLAAAASSATKAARSPCWTSAHRARARAATRRTAAGRSGRPRACCATGRARARGRRGSRARGARTAALWASASRWPRSAVLRRRGTAPCPSATRRQAPGGPRSISEPDQRLGVAAARRSSRPARSGRATIVDPLVLVGLVTGLVATAPVAR